MASFLASLADHRKLLLLGAAALVILSSFLLLSDRRDLLAFSYLSSASGLPPPSPSPPHPPPPPIPSPPLLTPPVDPELISNATPPAASATDADVDSGGVSVETEPEAGVTWEMCKVAAGLVAADYIPCLDNVREIKRLKSRKRMEHRERHCPQPSSRCLVPLPPGYREPVPWPQSRDMIWYNNVPHTKLVEYKKDQNWVRQSGEYLVFPGGGTQFKEGATNYIQFIQQILPSIDWGQHVRVILDVGCGVATFGGYLLDKHVLAMSFAPKDEHEAQVQFALERGIPAFLAVIGTQKLPYPDNAFDLIHCARCRVHWHGDGGRPLLELNRILRPGGYYVWSATPVYRHEPKEEDIWNVMVSLTQSICWRMVTKSIGSNGIGAVIFQKPTSNSCYYGRQSSDPPLCSERARSRIPWYVPLDKCIPLLDNTEPDQERKWPVPWPQRLEEPDNAFLKDQFSADSRKWKELVSDVYFNQLPVNWSIIRNVMDLNAGFGGFAAALIEQPVWVMNVVPVSEADTLLVIFNRGLIGVYHDWCESFNTYPRTYDLLHANYLLSNLTSRCDLLDIASEMDRILRPGRWIILRDTTDTLKKMQTILWSLHYYTTISKQEFLVAHKGLWRPGSSGYN